MTKYLYNGIELPALPEYDKTAYPYAVIEKSQYGGELYFFHAFAEAPTMSGNDITLSGDRVYCSSNSGEDWGTLYNGTTISHGKGFIKWSNTDILNADGSVYLAASVPIPANGYEAHLYNGTWQKGTFYKRLNGAWVKHQAYRRVNGAWVKVKE